MEHPLRFLPQGIAAAIDQAGGQFDDHILDIVHRDVRRDSAHHHGGAAEVLDFNARIGQQVNILQNGLLFRRRSG